jgi:hypothetical protein
MLFHATESQAEAIFATVFILLTLAAIVISSARTGLVAYSMRSMLQTKPLYTVDKSRWPYYLKVVAFGMIINILFMLTFDTKFVEIVVGIFYEHPGSRLCLLLSNTLQE